MRATAQDAAVLILASFTLGLMIAALLLLAINAAAKPPDHHAAIHRLQDQIAQLWDVVDQQTHDLIRLQAAEPLNRANCVKLLYPNG